MIVDFKSTPLEPLALQARVVQFSRTTLPHGAAKFIAIFLRFEFALKEHGYMPSEGAAEVEWERVARDLQRLGFFERIRKSGRAETVLKEPPKKQMSDDGYLRFKEMPPPRNAHELLVAVRRVRNNLLHGGKSGDPEGNERNRTLIAEAQWIVEEVLHELPEVRAYFEGRY